MSNNTTESERPEIIHTPDGPNDTQVIIDDTKTYIRYDAHKKKLAEASGANDSGEDSASGVRVNARVGGTLYRVYSTYHESSESGTNEYGYYTDRGDAFDRAVEVAKERIKNNVKYSKEKTEQELIEEIGKTDNGISFWDGIGWDKSYIRVKEIEVNKATDKSMVGYT